jgi:hypothetical protein
MTKLLLLPISKRDMPADANAAAALQLIPKALATAPALKTKTAVMEFWNSLSDYASRNLAELSGARSNGAEKKAAANGTVAQTKTEKPKRVHSKQRKPAGTQQERAATASA